MPFGVKPGPGGSRIDFDAVYRELIAPAVVDADLEPLRADEEQAGGIIHKPMFERLILCPYAVADLTAANANVFYELGLRHGVKPASTTLIFAEGGGALPFDVVPLRGLPYKLGGDGKPSDVATDRANLTRRLIAARENNTDSPVFQMVDGFPDIQRLKTDVFRDRVDIAKSLKLRLAAARKLGPAAGLAALAAIEAELAAGIGGLVDAEAGVVIDLFLSYRAVKAWPTMIELVGKMTRPLANTTLVQEQLGFALNRAGDSERAEQVLKACIAEHGASSENCGLLGRVYKDRWEAALAAGNDFEAQGQLELSVSTYLQGFEADWRDAYPGINALTLMELSEPPDPRRDALIPVVSYAVDRRIIAGKPDYWDHATRLELALLALDEKAARSGLGKALAAVREAFEPETTARNLRLIRECRERRATAGGTAVPKWCAQVEAELMKVHDRLNAVAKG
jgi:hypothetical protein